MSDTPTRSASPAGEPTADPPAPEGGTTPELPQHTLPQPITAVRFDLPSAPPGYELIEEVGAGGMGVVYRAREIALNRDVAVKFLQDRYPADSPGARRFVEEARITAQLQHPAIPPVHHVGTLSDGRPFLAMKLIKGETLADLLVTEPGNRGRFVAVFAQVCQAVAYAHARKVIHRDLKPANVMVGAFGEVQVMDWGLAKVLGASELTEPTVADERTEIRSLRDADLATQAGSILGTPAFMAPEQAGGEVGKIDERSDVFGLGAVLCTILTGKPPYWGSDSDSIRLLAIRGETADALARLDACGADAELVALAKRCLSRDREARPRDASEVARAVSAHLAAAEERARQAELDAVRAEGERARAEAEMREQRKRRRVQLALAATVGLLLFSGGVFAWWAEKQAAPHRERRVRNGEAVAENLKQCENALRTDDVVAAESALKEAERRAGEGGAEHLEDRLARCRDDLEMLRDLNQIDDLWWEQYVLELRVWGDDRVFQAGGSISGVGSAAMKTRIEKWMKAFEKYGIVPGTTPPDEAARRVNRSLVKNRLLTALDQLFRVANFRTTTSHTDGRRDTRWLIVSRPYNPTEPPATDVLAILRAADPNEFRCAVREAALPVVDSIGPKDIERFLKLVESPAALEQPTWFTVVLSSSLYPLEKDQLERILHNAVRRRPGHFAVLVALGHFYWLDPDPARRAESEGWFRAALAVRPESVAMWILLGCSRCDKGDLAGGIAAYREAIRLKPDLAHVHNILAWMLATGPDDIRNSRLAVEHATQACKLTNWRPLDELDTLAAAYAEAGEFDKAIEYQEKVLSLPGVSSTLGGPIRPIGAEHRLLLYKRKLPYRDPALARREVAPPPREK